MSESRGTGRFEVDPSWPHLPADMMFGQVVQVVVDASDRVFLFQRINPRVMLFSVEGAMLGTWSDDTAFPDLHSAWHGRDDDGEYLLVVDRDRNALARTALDGTKVWEIVSERFNRPTDAAAASTGDIYVSDGYGNACVHQFSAKGEHIRTWGSPGSGPGEFNLPHGVWITMRGDDECVYICDRENHRIQVFSLSGELVDIIPDLARPTDIYVGSDGTRYVSELLHRVTILDSQDRVIEHIGGEPAAVPGEFDAPHAVWLDSSGAMYVTEVLEGRRAQKFNKRAG